MESGRRRCFKKESKKINPLFIVDKAKLHETDSTIKESFINDIELGITPIESVSIYDFIHEFPESVVLSK